MTLDDLRTYVRQRLTVSTADSATTTQIDTAINQARLRLVARFRLKVATTTLDFTADTETVALPSDCTEILSISTADYLLQAINEQDFGQLTSGSGGPQVFVRDGTSAVIRVRPVPQSTENDAATIRYVQRPTALSSGTDVPSEVPDEFHDLVGELAVHRIAQNEEDLDLARAAWNTIYGNPGNPQDLGLWGELSAYVNRMAGTTVNQIQLRGAYR